MGVDVLEDLPFDPELDWGGAGDSPVSTDSAGRASESSRLGCGTGILDAPLPASLSVSLRCVSTLAPSIPATPSSILAGVSLKMGLPSVPLSTARPTLERASPRVGLGPGNVLSVTRFDAEDEGLFRPLPDCVPFCGAREDCGRLAVEVGLVAFRAALKVPMTGDGANIGDSATTPVLFLLLR